MHPFAGIKQLIVQLQPLTESEWSNFEMVLQYKSLNKGTFLVKEGQVADHLYYLNKGASRNFFIKDGQEFTLDFHFEGDFVSAFQSFITREPSLVFIELLQDAEIVIIEHDALYNFYSRNPIGERVGRLMAELQYIRRLQKEMDLLSLTAEEQYAKMMAKNPLLISNISSKHLSSYLGIQPESLSRIKKLYQKR